jgi:hypothetical protein
VEPLLAFAATLVSLRLAGELVRRRRSTRSPALGWWAASLAAFAIASAALAWGAAAGWDDRSFRLYYLCGGLLTAALLGTGSLVRFGVRWIAPVALVYVGLAVGVALAEPLTAPVSGGSIPDAQEHLDLVPARVLAIAGGGRRRDRDAAAAAGRQRPPAGGHRRGRPRQRSRRARGCGVGDLLRRRLVPALRRLRRQPVVESSSRIVADGRVLRRRRPRHQTRPSSAATSTIAPSSRAMPQVVT